jgi:Flp pilus assembly protein TadG
MGDKTFPDVSERGTKVKTRQITAPGRGGFVNFPLMQRRQLTQFGTPAALRGDARARRRLGRRGSTTVEFCCVALAFFPVLVGIMEAAWQFTVASALERATLRASRFGITGQQTRPGAPSDITCRSQAIRWVVTTTAGGILRADRLTVTTTAYGSPTGMAGNGTAGAGTGGQVVLYQLRYEEPFLLPAMWSTFFRTSERMVHQTSMVVKNEMFANATC